MLLGLHGKMRSGKDTICQMIQEDFADDSIRVIRDAFADRLKLSAYRCFKPDATIEEALAWSDRLKAGGFVMASTSDSQNGLDTNHTSGRQFLQHYGTEAHRQVFDTDFWVNAVLPDWEEDDYGRGDELGPNDILVITDVRFPNEAARILDAGGSVWHVVRPSVDAGDPHVSERILPDDLISLRIENLSTLDALRAKVHAAVWSEFTTQVR